MRSSFPRTVVALFLLSSLASDVLLAQEPDWLVVSRVPIGFFETRKTSKNVIVASDAAHYALIGKVGADDEAFVSDDTLTTLRRVRRDAHPILHYDLAHPTRSRLYVVADSVEWNGSFWAPLRGVIFRSLDRGARWDTVELPIGTTIGRIAMADSMHGVAAQLTSGAPLLRTTDGWTTWQQIALPEGITSVSSLVAPEPDLYILNGRTRTTDGGATWEHASAPPPAGIQRIRFIDRDRGWAAGGVSNGNGHQRRDVIARTTDGGMTWSTMLDADVGPLPFGLRDIAFADSLHGYASGDVAKVLYTEDGGVTWSQQSLPDSLTTAYNLTFLAYPTKDVAVGVGNGAVVRRVTGALSSAPVAAIATPRVSPNPASSTITIDGLAVGTRIVLTTIDGRVVAGSRTIDHDAGTRIDIATLPDGIYVLRTEAHGRTNASIVVVHR